MSPSTTNGTQQQAGGGLGSGKNRPSMQRPFPAAPGGPGPTLMHGWLIAGASFGHRHWPHGEKQGIHHQPSLCRARGVAGSQGSATPPTGGREPV